jgi:hypothetical protein
MPACHAGDRGFESRRFRPSYQREPVPQGAGSRRLWRKSPQNPHIACDDVHNAWRAAVRATRRAPADRRNPDAHSSCRVAGGSSHSWENCLEYDAVDLVGTCAGPSLEDEPANYTIIHEYLHQRIPVTDCTSAIGQPILSSETHSQLARDPKAIQISIQEPPIVIRVPKLLMLQRWGCSVSRLDLRQKVCADLLHT